MQFKSRHILPGLRDIVPHDHVQRRKPCVVALRLKPLHQLPNCASVKQKLRNHSRVILSPRFFSSRGSSACALRGIPGPRAIGSLLRPLLALRPERKRPDRRNADEPNQSSFHKCPLPIKRRNSSVPSPCTTYFRVSRKIKLRKNGCGDFLSGGRNWIWLPFARHEAPDCHSAVKCHFSRTSHPESGSRRGLLSRSYRRALPAPAAADGCARNSPPPSLVCTVFGAARPVPPIVR